MKGSTVKLNPGLGCQCGLIIGIRSIQSKLIQLVLILINSLICSGKVELVQYIVVNNSLGMGKGKIAAQCSHASVAVLEKVSAAVIDEWKSQGMKKIVLKVKTTDELLELLERVKKEFPCALITDSGRTQVGAGSKTCFACGPVEESKSQKYFKDLKLL